MAPIRLSHSWYRRFYVGLFIAALGFLLLPLLSHILPHAAPSATPFPLITTIGGALVAVASCVLFVIQKKLTSYIPAYVTFAIFLATAAYTVQANSGIYSDFIGLWALAAFIAPLFGALGWVPVLVLIGISAASTYLQGSLTTEAIILLAVTSIIPLGAGLIVWLGHNETDDNGNRDVKNLASQLSEVAAKSEIVINAIGDGVIAIDSTGVIQLINPAAQEILGWGKQDALMLNYKSILKLADQNYHDLDPALDPIQQVLNTNQQTRGDKLTAITNSGKKISIALVASPIGGPGSGAIAVFRDVTNERAEEREQAEFISTASHEMRTPVASIEGYLGLALNPNTATIDTRAHDFIMKAHEAAQHLGRLFQDLLDVSKSEDGRMTNTPRVVDLVAFTSTVVEGLTQKASEKGLQLTFVPSAQSAGASQGFRKLMPVYYVNLDVDHVREVLDNLIENAIKYTPSGSVEVDITGSDEKVVVSIKDSGLGIPTEDIPHLFQKFYRVDNADRQSIGGTGLGLYLCRRLVEAMQGRLWVESTFGSGSTFFVELPRIDTQEATRLLESQQQQAVMAPAPAPVQPITPAPAATPIPVTIVESTPAQPVAPVAQTAPTISPVAPVATPSTNTAPATTVPRGESLTREQINERVRQLEALAAQQRGSVTPPPRQ